MATRNAIQRGLLLASMFVLHSSAHAQLNQLEPLLQLHGNLEYSSAQIMSDVPAFSSIVLDDFTSAGTVTGMSAAFELSDPSLFAQLPARVAGWRVSVFANWSDAELSGPNLTGSSIATVTSANVAYGDLGIVNGVRAFTVELSGLSLATGTGQFWIGMSAVMPFAGNGQIFLLGNSSPTSTGGGALNNARFVNPGEAYGEWRSQSLGDNAAYKVQTVPEPASLLALTLGAILTYRRKNSLN